MECVTYLDLCWINIYDVQAVYGMESGKGKCNILYMRRIETQTIQSSNK